MGSQEYSTAVASQASTVWHRQVRGKQWGPGRIGRGVFQVTGISPEKKNPTNLTELTLWQWKMDPD